MPRQRDVGRVDIVRRDRRLRKVIQQVIRQHLDRRQRQKRQEQARPQHTEHVADIRAGAHADVFGDIDKYPASLQYAAAQYQQVLFQQNDVGRLLGDIDGAVHRQAHVGRLQRRTVIDAVAEKADHVPLAAQQTHHARLLRRRQLGKDARALRQIGQRHVVQAVDAAAQHHLARVQADFAAHLAGDDVVIARKDFHGHATVRQCLERGGGALLGRIEEGDIAGQGQARLVGDAVGIFILGNVLVGNGDDAKAIVIQCPCLLLGGGNMRGIEHAALAVCLVAAADGHDFFDRALADHQVAPFRRGHHHGQAPPGKIEGDFIDLGIARIDAQQTM